jgi:translocation and assembly module TamB
LLALVLAGSAVGGLVLFAWICSDRLLTGLYDHWRPWIERQVGTVMGHPLQLGSYQGFGPGGVEVGPSRFLPGKGDDSTITVRGVRARVRPLASWQQQSLQLELDFIGAEVYLRRNRLGQLWKLGSLSPGRRAPRLNLTFRLLEPAKVRLWGFSQPDRGPLQAQVRGQANLDLPASRIDVRARLEWPRDPGALLLLGQGQWGKGQRWQGDFTARGLALTPLSPLLPLPPSSHLAGHADGQVRLSLLQGVAGCSGLLKARDVRWRASPKAPDLALASLPLRCNDAQLELASSRWRYQTWAGTIAGRLTRQLGLNLLLQAEPPKGLGLGPTPLLAKVGGQLGKDGLLGARLQGRRGDSRLDLTGSVGRVLDLQGLWQVQASDLPPLARLPVWLRQQPLAGRLKLAGRLAAPSLNLQSNLAGQHPLLGAWNAAVAWRDGLLRLERLRAEGLEASAQLPLDLKRGRGLVMGDLKGQLDLRHYPLTRLGPLVGTNLQGHLDAKGPVTGPLNLLAADLQLRLQQPGAGPLALRETWSGRFQGLVGSGLQQARSGGQLHLLAAAPAPPGRIDTWLDARWHPVRIQLERGGGLLNLNGRPSHYDWQAKGLSLQGLALTLAPDQPLRNLQGVLGGRGVLELQPLSVSGKLQIERPGFLGLAARQLRASFAYNRNSYKLRTDLEPLGAGRLRGDLEGRPNGRLKSHWLARGLDAGLLRQLAMAWGLARGTSIASIGQASDLGSLVWDTLGPSLDQKLAALGRAEALANQRQAELRRLSRQELLARLQTSLDADLRLSGPDPGRLRVQLEARGHLWLGQRDRDDALGSEPLTFRLDGPLRGGEGQFELAGLTLGLLALLAPVPRGLSGGLGLKGTYRLGGAHPELVVDLALDQARIGPQPIALKRGRIQLRQAKVQLDLALRAQGAQSNVALVGQIPLNPNQSGLELRLSSRGDGLAFLSGLAGSALEWQQGSADLRLLVRGSLNEPIANGFVRLRRGQCLFIGQKLEKVEATVLFDFKQLEVQQLTAQVGRNGLIQGEGRLGLIRPLDGPPSLTVKLRQVPFSMSRLQAMGQGQLSLGGSLRSPQLGGEVTVSRGTLNVQPAAVSKGPGDASTSVQGLIEEGWKFDKPLVLLGPDMASATATSLADTVPNFPYLAFDNLRLRFGPDLRVVLPRVASFNTGGSLRISGRLDPSLRATGVVRLLSGRLNLFTTSFSLDPQAPNVAVFTPSLGLVPYLDIAMRTRISDSLGLIAPNGFNPTSRDAFAAAAPTTTLTPGAASLRQLNLILVTVSVSGPADRLGENIKMHSSPPLPQERLVALVGGNSLAGLGSGGAGTALATVLGQSLLSPLISSLSDALGQRVSLALYPTYVSPEVSVDSNQTSRRLPPQLVLGSEIGYDLSDRVNLSVLAAPNRTDIAPQMTLNYKASELINIETSVDTQGSWGSQLRMFLRF